MFRPSRIPTRGHGSVARQLAKLPSGTRVQLHYGSVFVRYVRQWMVAGREKNHATNSRTRPD
jgi:hypothetical protein